MGWPGWAAIVKQLGLIETPGGLRGVDQWHTPDDPDVLSFGNGVSYHSGGRIFEIFANCNLQSLSFDIDLTVIVVSPPMARINNFVRLGDKG